MTHENTGACFCGAVELEVTGAPEAHGLLPLRIVPLVVGRPVNAFTLWKPENVKVTKGADKIGHFQKSDRQRSPVLHGLRRPSADDHPLWNLTDVFAATIPGVEFKPGVHVNYAETVLPMKDGCRSSRISRRSLAVRARLFQSKYATEARGSPSAMRCRREARRGGCRASPASFETMRPQGCSAAMSPRVSSSV